MYNVLIKDTIMNIFLKVIIIIKSFKPTGAFSKCKKKNFKMIIIK